MGRRYGSGSSWAVSTFSLLPNFDLIYPYREESTRKWAVVAEKWFAIELGANTPQAKAAAEIVHKPKSHPSWMSRYRVKVADPAH